MLQRSVSFQQVFCKGVVIASPYLRHSDDPGEFRVVLALLVAVGAASAPCSARDLSLTDAEGLLATHNRELRAARRAVESAEAQRLIAGARPNASFSINSSEINRNPGIGGGSLGQKHIDTVFRNDQPLERCD